MEKMKTRLFDTFINESVGIGLQITRSQTTKSTETFSNSDLWEKDTNIPHWYVQFPLMT